MEDIYENLENYEDLSDVNELKNENKELKLKLEEYSRAMNQLQKDFDKLNSEYKKLEMNYSSLLITARAEIERKGEIIKNLNLEKDKLIIGSLQKSGVNMLRNRSNFHGLQKSISSQDKPIDSEKNRTKQVFEPKDTLSGNKSNSFNNENRSTHSEEKLLNIDRHKINTKEMKENISRNYHKDSTQPNAVSKRIMNRRKSTPALSFQEATFSSDEEVERLDVKNVRRSPPRSMRNDNRDDRVELYSYYGSSDANRSRYSNQIDYSTDRHADNFDMKRSHRYGSPERNQHRYSHDRSRHRLMRSPPPDKYNRSKSRDRRYNYDKYRYNEHSSLKHKTRHDFDEPSSKRLKTEQYSKCPSQDSNYISDREKEFSDKHIFKPEEFGQFSCQSPDYVHSETHVPQHYIKEIRNTAATSLEDPRISSKKYILETHNNKNILFIPSNRNIDIQCVDKTIWDIEKVEVPEALKNKPFSVRESEDYLNQIYSNIEGNESLESGEIQSIEDVVILNSKDLKKNVNNRCNDIPKESENRNMIDMAQQIIDSKVSQKSVEYKIPKKSQKNIKKPDTSSKDNDKKSTTHKGDLKVSIESNILSAKLKDKEHNSKPQTGKDREHDSKLQTSSRCKNKHTTGDNKKGYNKDSDKSSDDKTLQDKIRTVEGDLELSDEESDPMEFHKEIESKLAEKQETCAISSINKTETNSNALKKIEENLSINNAENINTEVTISKESSNSKGSSKESSRESGKKRRGKKKSESKDTTSIKDLDKDAKDRKKGSDKDNKKSSSGQPGNKFSDLFGDSSSLITPDDLGIEVTDAQVQRDVKYTSIFENNEDAIDISIEDVKKARVNTNEVNTFENVIENLPNEKIAKKTSSTNDKKDENSDSSQYENVKGETLLESSVVKTVIISTGVQASSVPDNKVSESNTLDDDKTNSNNLIVKKCPLSNIKALATSTPQKLVDLNDASLTTQDSRSNTINGTLEINSSCVNNSSSITPNEHETEDVPDVRIFVRRRRKVVRKPTT